MIKSLLAASWKEMRWWGVLFDMYGEEDLGDV
jgi:hypothetical protein